MGRRPHAVELARGHQRGDGQLRLRRGADPARAPRHRSSARSRTSRACRSTRSTPGIDWCFETFPEYLAALDERPEAAQRRRLRRPHAAAPVRARRRGAAGHRRRGRRRCAALVREAIEAGAIGFSTSRQPPTRAPTAGRCPSRFAEVDEVYALAAVLGELGKGVLQVVDRARPVRRPVLRAGRPQRRARHLDRARGPGRQARRRAAHRRAGRGAARRGLPADRLPPDRHADHPDRPRAPRRDRRVEGGARPAPGRAGRPLPRTPPGGTGPGPTTLDGLEPPLVEDRASRRPTRTTTLVGVPLDQLAAERGTTPFDLHARPGARRRHGHPLPRSCSRTTATTRSATCSPTSARCSACPTPAPTPASSATPATRPTCSATGSASARRSSLEDAVWRLTGHPHQAFRIPDRGLVQEGFHADLVAFDPDTVGCHAGRAGARPARRRRPPRRAQHRRRARLGQRRGDPCRGRGPARASRRVGSCAVDDASTSTGIRRRYDASATREGLRRRSQEHDDRH